MTKHSIAHTMPHTQVPPPSGLHHCIQSVIDGCPVTHRVELAAQLAHDEICLAVGCHQQWLECTAVYRNTIRRGVLALIDGHHGS
jgi:hypothetical protein